jgi:hypothetical protein
MELIAQFGLMSDAAQLAWTGAALWLVAGLAALMERRRNTRRDLARLEQVGWVPWTGLFLLTAMLGGGCLAMGLPAVLTG